VDGFPGNVYQITVTVPNPLPGTPYSPYFDMQVNGAFSQNGIMFSLTR
jgi:hypothetical protein